ncbi:MAG: Hint domain-containing protein [Paracoccaceae bacterium]
MAIGQAGSITTNSPTENQLITIDLAEPLTNPVFALTATNNGGHQYTLRVVDQTLDGDGNTTSFSFIMEEWEYLDGAHPATETINWIAVEEGVHTLPDGRVIEAGTTPVGDAGASVSFNGNYGSDTPVVLTSVMSNNDTTTVDSDPLNVTNSGFDIELQEEEAEADDHGTETIGWIAIQPGGDAASGTATRVGGVDDNTDVLSLGDTFSAPIVVAETQTINGGNPETVKIDGLTSTTIGLYLEEEQSADNETNHIDEDVGFVAFESGLIPCFTPGAQVRTARGLVAVENLQAGQLLVTRDNGLQPLRWVCRRTLGTDHLVRNPQHRPVLIKAGALGPDLPERDLLVSPQHRMLMEGWRAELFFGPSEILVPARGFVNDQTVTLAPKTKPVTYLHLLLDRHEVICVNGAWTESLHAGQLSKGLMPDAAREELFQLFPNLRSYAQSFGATIRPVATVREAMVLN